MKRSHPTQPVWLESLRKPLTGLLCAMALVFYGFRFVHLKADFPDISRWTDWSMMADEGWFASGAVHREVFGRWLLPDVSNPLLVMPVWPSLSHLWFELVGYGIVPLRALSLLFLGVALILLFRLLNHSSGTLWAALAVALVAASPFVYSFSRLANPETMLLYWLFLGWTLGSFPLRHPLVSVAGAMLTGLAITGLALSAPIGIALAPSVLLFQWCSGAESGTTVRRAGQVIATAAVANTSWMAYRHLIAGSHRGSFDAPAGISPSHLHLDLVRQTTWTVLRDSASVDPALFVIAFMALVLAALLFRDLWNSPPFAASVLAAVSYLAAIALGGQSAPGMYMVLVPLLAVITVMTLRKLLQRGATTLHVPSRPVEVRISTLGTIGFVLVILLLVVTAGSSLRYVARFDYKYRTAMDSAGSTIHHESGVSPTVLSDFGENISLFVAVPAVNPDHATVPATELLDAYQPGWYATLLDGPPGKVLPALQMRYQLIERGRYPLLKGANVPTLVLYRLVPRLTP